MCFVSFSFFLFSLFQVFSEISLFWWDSLAKQQCLSFYGDGASLSWVGIQFDSFSVAFLESMKIFCRGALSLSLSLARSLSLSMWVWTDRDVHQLEIEIEIRRLCWIPTDYDLSWDSAVGSLASTSYFGYKSQRMIIVLGLLLLYSVWCLWTCMCWCGRKSIKARFWSPKFLKILLSSDFMWWFAELLGFTRGMSSPLMSACPTFVQFPVFVSGGRICGLSFWIRVYNLKKGCYFCYVLPKPLMLQI